MGARHRRAVEERYAFNGTQRPGASHFRAQLPSIVAAMLELSTGSCLRSQPGQVVGSETLRAIRLMRDSDAFISTAGTDCLQEELDWEVYRLVRA